MMIVNNNNKYWDQRSILNIVEDDEPILKLPSSLFYVLIDLTGTKLIIDAVNTTIVIRLRRGF